MTRDEWRRVEPLATQALGCTGDEQQALIETANLSEPIRRELLAALRRIEQSASLAVVAPAPVAGTPAMSVPARLPVLEPGAALAGGRFVVVRQIGAGGMGTVFLAHDLRLSTLVALKVTPFDERLLAEARRAAACSGHPHVPTIHDVLQERIGDEDVGVLVMDYVAGTPASRILDDGPVDLTRALRWARQVAEAVAHAHDHQVLHCDLKPGNIIITPEDDAKVLDFGIARATFDASDPAEPLRGTVPYMAPEQIVAKQFSPAGDIYSLGVTLFELLTGTLPFEGDDAALRLRIVVAPPPPLSAVAGTRAEILQLESILDRALAKDPEDRYRSARALKRELDRVYDQSRTEPVPVPPPAPVPPVGVATVAAAATGMLALLTLLGFIASRALDSGLGRTAEFRVESPLWWPVWGAMSLFAPVVGVAVPLLIGSVLMAAAARLVASTELGRRGSRRAAAIVRSARGRTALWSRNSVGHALVVLQLGTVAFVLWQFSDLLRGIFAFMDPTSTASLVELRPSNGEVYGLLRRSLSAQLVVFGAAWWILIRRGVGDAAIPLAGGAAIALVTLFFFALPFRILNHNEHRRVSYGAETCYLTAERGAEILLFCPQPPRTRVIDADDPALERGREVEDIFSEFDRSASAPGT